ncbi:DUF2384 domain-containing protein [Halomonas dongshanensis]|uniref:DUF2384 domain-containing protein n=1 Tax=Halomonas dongshanensis TaxID=2890835 RepID=A0ABT2EA51_9GAMM|nr:DUF2384 domain-containing protein [Halomonas dongshanensis]MCS2608457.1 DUF2384 domain-containing protein [Halomonas dongshanensis]
MTTEALHESLELSSYRAPESFDHFVQDLKTAARPDGQPIISPRLFASALSMDLQILAKRAHVHRTTIARAAGSEKLQSFLRDAMRVLAAATDINGNFHDALFWFRNEPISAFDYKTPEQLVSDGRSEDILRYVCALQAGAVG